MKILPNQIRAARALLDLSRDDLARACGIASRTLDRIDRGDTVRQSTIDAIRAALEAAGVDFISENGGGAGVRLRRPRALQEVVACSDCGFKVAIYGAQTDPKTDYDAARFPRSCQRLGAVVDRDGPAVPSDCGTLRPALEAATARFTGKP